MADYRQSDGDMLFHRPTGEFRHRLHPQYLEWLAAGNTPDPIPPTPPPPTVDEILDDLMAADDQTRRVLKAVIKLLAQRFNLPLDQVKQAIRNNM